MRQVPLRMVQITILTTSVCLLAWATVHFVRAYAERARSIEVQWPAPRDPLATPTVPYGSERPFQHEWSPPVDGEVPRALPSIGCPDVMPGRERAAPPVPPDPEAR